MIDKSKKTLQNLRLAWKLTVSSLYADKRSKCTLNPSLYIFKDDKFEILLMDEIGNPWLHLSVSLNEENPLHELQQKIRNLGFSFKLTSRELRKKYPNIYSIDVTDSIIEQATWFCKNLYFSIENVKEGPDIDIWNI